MQVRLQFVLLLIGLFAGLAEAQNPSVPPGLAGSVQDTSGAVIVGAQVVVTTQDGRTIAQGATDSSGSFRFANISAGSYTVDVTEPGFQEVQQQIKMGSGTRPQLRIVMLVASTSQDVTVAAPDSPAQVSTEISQNQSANTVDRDGLDRLPVFDQDYITTCHGSSIPMRPARMGLRLSSVS